MLRVWVGRLPPKAVSTERDAVGPAFSREPLEDAGRVCLTLGPGWDCHVQQCDGLMGPFGEMDLGSSPLSDEGAPHLRSVL